MSPEFRELLRAAPMALLGALIVLAWLFTAVVLVPWGVTELFAALEITSEALRVIAALAVECVLFGAFAW